MIVELKSNKPMRFLEQKSINLIDSNLRIV